MAALESRPAEQKRGSPETHVVAVLQHGYTSTETALIAKAKEAVGAEHEEILCGVVAEGEANRSRH